MIVLVGASASGKTEVAKLIIKNHGFEKMVTTTTRPMRVGEVADVDYHFLTKEEFLKKKENNEFLETTLYNGNYYGTHRSDVGDKKVVIVEVEGANILYKELGSDVMIFYLEASEQERINRMCIRHDNPEDINKRIISDRVRFSPSLLDHVDQIIDTNNQTLIDLSEQIYNLYENRSKRAN